MPIFIPLDVAENIDDKKKDYYMLSDKGMNQDAKTMASGIIQTTPDGKLEYLARGLRTSYDKLKLNPGSPNLGLFSDTEAAKVFPILKNTIARNDPITTLMQKLTHAYGAYSPITDSISVDNDNAYSDILNHEFDHRANFLSSSTSERLKNTFLNPQIYSKKAYGESDLEKKANLARIGSYYDSKTPLTDGEIDQLSRAAVSSAYSEGILPATIGETMAKSALPIDKMLDQIKTRKRLFNNVK